MREQRRFVFGVFSNCKKATVNLWMKRLDAAVHHFREAR